MLYPSLCDHIHHIYILYALVVHFSLIHHYSQCGDEYTDKQLFYRVKAAAKALTVEGFGDVHDNLSVAMHLTTDLGLLNEMLTIVSSSTEKLAKSAYAPTDKLERSLTVLSEALDYTKALEELELALLLKLEAVENQATVAAEIKEKAGGGAINCSDMVVEGTPPVGTVSSGTVG